MPWNRDPSRPVPQPQKAGSLEKACERLSIGVSTNSKS